MTSESRGFKDKRLILPVVLFIVTTIYLITALQIRPQIDEGLVGPSFIPVLASLFMYIALGFVVHGIVRDQSPAEEDRQSFWLLTQMVVATAAYILLFKILGYPLATFLYVYVMFYIFDLEEKKQVKRVLYSIGITGVFYILYSVVFQVRLPIFRGGL